MTTPRDLKSKTMDELRALADTLGLKGYSKLRKNELVRLLAQRRAVAPQSTPAARNARSKRAGSSLNKPETPLVPAPVARPEPAARLRPQTAAPLSAEERVESAKFAFAPPELALAQLPPGADLGEDIECLPSPREPRLALLPQKPGILHAYWVLPGVVKRPLRLRLYCIVAGELEIIEEIALPATHGQWYFHVPETFEAGEFLAHLGYYEADGRFVNASARAIARIPSLYASERTDQLWWIGEECFRALYLRAGGYLRAGRLGWPGATSSPSGVSSRG